MISESGSAVEAMLRSPGFPSFSATAIDHQRLDRLDPMQNQMCRVCEEPAAGFHFGAFTCEGCKSFFGRTCNNQSVIQECKNNYRCVVDKKNRTACKACRLRKCLMVGMSKSGSRYGRRSNWFKIHCLMQQSLGGGSPSKKSSPSSSGGPSAPPSMSTEVSPLSSSSLSPSSPPRSWSSHKEAAISPKIEPDLRRSPDNAPTMVPRTSSIGCTPFASLMSRPLSPPMMKQQPPSSVSSDAMASLPSLYGFPGFPLMSAPGLHNLPFHKQALLSPLLAHSHLWQMARANPLLSGGVRPELDLMAEHKALMERFAAAAMAAQSAAAAAAASAAASAAKDLKEKEEETRSFADHNSSPPCSPKRDESTQNAPIDLSNKKSSDEEGSTTDEEMASIHEKSFKKVKSDLNRNVVVQHSSDDEDEEELDVGGK